jgi:hypothetical protein
MGTPEFAEYARAQRAYGEQLRAVHVPDETGCCRHCGRLAPCDAAKRGDRLVAHFGVDSFR